MAVLAVVDKKTNKVINHIVAELTDIPPEDTFFVDTKEHGKVKREAKWNGKNFENPPEDIVDDAILTPKKPPSPVI